MTRGNLASLVEPFVAALRAGNETQARQIIQRARELDVNTGEIYLQLFGPSMVQIGELWEHNRLSVAEEHLATAMIERLIGELSPLFRSSTEASRRIVLGCIQGEYHMLGIRMLSDLFEGAGWKVLYLGANVPTEEWPRIVGLTTAQAVGLSVNSSRLLPEARRTIAMLRTQHPTVQILVGGAIVEQEPDLAQLLGADIIARDPYAAISALGALG